MKIKKNILIGEFLGSCFLVMIIVGSGIMAENLTNDDGIRLLANTIATGAGLFVLITAFADISGAHFNPFVSLAMFFRKKIKGNLLKYYIPAQIFGCLLGVMFANVFFEHSLLELSTKNRDGLHIFVSEIIATFGLIFIIFATLKLSSSELTFSKLSTSSPISVNFSIILLSLYFVSKCSLSQPIVNFICLGLYSLMVHPMDQIQNG